jgi:hypothetical protein
VIIHDKTDLVDPGAEWSIIIGRINAHRQRPYEILDLNFDTRHNLGCALAPSETLH